MSKKILLIDDSEEQLEIHKHYLEDTYDVICCTNGIKAVNLAQEFLPDIILMDIEMPYMDGTEATAKIRARKDCYHIPIIGLTGHTSQSTILKFMSCGGNAYLAKPVQKELLIDTIEQFLNLEQKKASQKKILIVDDDQSSLHIMKNFLQEQYYVAALKSGTQAMDYLHKFTPDLILLDYQMAPFNGISVYNMIQRTEKGKNIPIAFVTGVTDKEVLLACSEVQPAGIILKPLQKDILLQKIQDIFDEV